MSQWQKVGKVGAAPTDRLIAWFHTLVANFVEFDCEILAESDKVCDKGVKPGDRAVSASDPTNHSESLPGKSPERFAATRWSVVRAAGRNDMTAGDALTKLCQTYWYPLYAYVRRRGHSAEDAEDLTQEFFARLLAGNWISDADPEKGRFRSFLLSAMKHFLADEWDRARAQKRGGGVIKVPIHLDSAETRYGQEPADESTPERIFEKRWALALLENVLGQLRSEYETDGKGDLFNLLTPCLVGERTSQPYAELGQKLGVSEGTIKAAVHRLRQRYRELLRHEIAHTLTEPGEVDDELRHLFAILSGP